MNAVLQIITGSWWKISTPDANYGRTTILLNTTTKVSDRLRLKEAEQNQLSLRSQPTQVLPRTRSSEGGRRLQLGKDDEKEAPTSERVVTISRPFPRPRVFSTLFLSKPWRSHGHTRKLIPILFKPTELELAGTYISFPFPITSISLRESRGVLR